MKSFQGVCTCYTSVSGVSEWVKGARLLSGFSYGGNYLGGGGCEYQLTGLSLKDSVILVDIGQESVAIELSLIKIL